MATDEHTATYWKRLTVTSGLAVTAGVLLMTTAAPVYAQQEVGPLLEEIVVTARKREESLQDIPVSITALSSNFIAEAGVEDMYDLFENTPGISWEQSQDRQGSRPTVRGVQTAAQAPSRQKMTSFLDGMPVAGQQGGIQFVGVDRVEVMRGPQSAAFGRATFAGAINYVSRNPGDEFDGDVKVSTSDLGRNEVVVSVGGPISDTFGYTLDASLDEFKGADEWVTTDGFRMGGQETTYVTGKLTFAPSDRFDGYVRFIYSDINDTIPVEWFPTKAERDACTNITLGMGRAYIEGDYNCEVAVPAEGYPRNHQPQEVFPQGSPEFFAAQAYSVLDPSSRRERNRIQGQLNFNMDSGSVVQVLAYRNEDALRRWYDSDTTGANPVVRFAMGMPLVRGVSSMANPATSDENYLEARWLSPDEDRLRWLIGASLYDYTTGATVWSVYAGVVLGLEDEGNAGNAFTPNQILSDSVTSSGIFGNVTYDLTDRTTVSFEARAQRDDLTNTDYRTGFSFNNSTDSFQPRFGITHALSDRLTLYGQLSSGTNPAGSNLLFVEPGRIRSLEAAGRAGAVSFDETTFLTFDEEQITNFEVGVKGSILNNRLSFATTYYVMDWEDMIQPFTLNWSGDWNDGTFSNGETFTNQNVNARTFINVGDGDLSGLEFEGTWQINESWRIRGVLTAANARFATFCDPIAVTSYGLTPTHTPATGALTNCVDVSGNDLIEQPDNTLVLSPTYSSGNIGDSNWTWSARLDLRYASKEWVDTMNIMSLPATTSFNGSLSFRDDSWVIRLYGNNLGDEDTPRRIQYRNDNSIGVSGGGRQNFTIRARIPREIGFTVSYRF